MSSRGRLWLHGDRYAGKLSLTIRCAVLDPGVSNQLTEGLLLQHEENSVEQLDVFGEVVQLGSISELSRTLGTSTYVVEDDKFVSPTRAAADALVQAVVPN